MFVDFLPVFRTGLGRESLCQWSHRESPARTARATIYDLASNPGWHFLRFLYCAAVDSSIAWMHDTAFARCSCPVKDNTLNVKCELCPGVRKCENASGESTDCERGMAM